MYFLVGDHKAADVLIFWEYSTSTADARRIAEQAFWSLIAATPPSEYEDVFSFDDAAGVRYGYRAGRPWVVDVAALSESRRPSRLPQPTGRVSVAGIFSLTTGALAGLLTATNLSSAAALTVGLTAWIVTAVAIQRKESGE